MKTPPSRTVPRPETSDQSSALSLVTLHLARGGDSDDGNAQCGHFLLLPLDAENRLDVAAWQRQQSSCKVCRFWQGETQSGRLVRRRGGADGRAWGFTYAGHRTIFEEIHELLAHPLTPGDYVSIRVDGRAFQPFLVASVLHLDGRHRHGDIPAAA